ncbi:uncharacterized protein BDV14DRAFT_175233 [Aspergillus stella-maris]|uniref:uncharacterized protein n=1 Tax=Aspergillus stella-maris TaxID=1810926 RepID=UPI003CCCD75C
MMKGRRPQPEDFTLGWICPLPLEFAAKKRALDKLYENAPVHRQALKARQAYMESLRFDQMDSRYQTIKMAHLKTC